MASSRRQRDLPKEWSKRAHEYLELMGWHLVPEGHGAQAGDVYVDWVEGETEPGEASDWGTLLEDRVPRVTSFGPSPTRGERVVLVLFRKGPPGATQVASPAGVQARNPDSVHREMLRFFGTPASRWGDQARFKE